MNEFKITRIQKMPRCEWFERRERRRDVGCGLCLYVHIDATVPRFLVVIAPNATLHGKRISILVANVRLSFGVRPLFANDRNYTHRNADALAFLDARVRIEDIRTVDVVADGTIPTVLGGHALQSQVLEQTLLQIVGDAFRDAFVVLLFVAPNATGAQAIFALLVGRTLLPGHVHTWL